MKLITENVEDVTVISEAAENGKKTFYIEGVFMMGNIQNRNGRYYPVETLENATNKYVSSHVESKRAFGELGHPDGPSINLDRVSHLIESLKRDGNNFIGRAKILPTPMGNIAAGILEAGGKLGVSTRGLGSLEETNKGYKLVKNDFFLSTAADIVADPSAPDAFVKGIMEGVEFCWENDLLIAKKTQDQIDESVRTRSLTDERKLEIFEGFVRNIAENKYSTKKLNNQPPMMKTKSYGFSSVSQSHKDYVDITHNGNMGNNEDSLRTNIDKMFDKKGTFDELKKGMTGEKGSHDYLYQMRIRKSHYDKVVGNK